MVEALETKIRLTEAEIETIAQFLLPKAIAYIEANFKEEATRAIVKDELAKIFNSIFKPSSLEQEWLPTTEAWKKLGFNSRDALMAYVETDFTYGVHYCDRRKSDSSQAVWFFNIREIEKYFARSPSQRRKSLKVAREKF